LAISCAVFFSLLLVTIGATSPVNAQGVTPLSLGVPEEGTFSSSNESHYYQVKVEAGEHLFVVLDADATSSRNELYIRYGGLPNRDEYDDKYDLPNKPDQAVEIANTQAGTYYVRPTTTLPCPS